MTTATGPSLDDQACNPWADASCGGARKLNTTSSKFDTFIGGFGDLVLDVGRAKLIDVEMFDDDENIPDFTDVRTGDYAGQSSGLPPVASVAIIAGVAVLLFIFATR